MRFPTPNKPHITKDCIGWYVGYPYGLAIPTEHVEAARVFKDRLNDAATTKAAKELGIWRETATLIHDMRTANRDLIEMWGSPALKAECLRQG